MPGGGVVKDNSSPNELAISLQHPKALTTNPRSYNAVPFDQRLT